MAGRLIEKLRNDEGKVGGMRKKAGAGNTSRLKGPRGRGRGELEQSEEGEVGEWPGNGER